MYETRFTAMMELTAYVEHGIDEALTNLFGQTQLFLSDKINNDARQRVKRIALITAHIRDIAGLLREVQPSHSGAAKACEMKISSVSQNHPSLSKIV